MSVFLQKATANAIESGKEGDIPREMGDSLGTSFGHE
jgi:hypothetical protein